MDTLSNIYNEGNVKELLVKRSKSLELGHYLY